MTTEGKYIYGFISETEPRNLGSIGIDQGEVHILNYKDIAAVVSDLPVKPFDALSREALLRNLAVYQSVIEKVMQSHHIIPVKFGTVTQGEAEVKNILKNGFGQINTSLKEMKNKIEIDLAALWGDLEAILKETGEEEGIKALKAEAASKPPEQIFQIKLSVGKLIKESLDKKRAECASLILKTLEKDVEDYYAHSLMDDSMIMNNAFLLKKEHADIFEKKVHQLDEHFRGRVNFRIVGPLPPYSFSTFEITKMGFRELNEARELLGLATEITPTDIKATYWDLARKFHPDKFPDDSEAQKRFEKINKAYHVLRNYSQQGGRSLKEADVRGWIAVAPVDRLQPGA